MTFWGAYLEAMRRYAVLEGRTSRSELFAYLGCLAIVLFAAAFADRALLRVEGIGFLLIITVVAHVVPTLAVAVRRVHDTDTPGTVLFIGVIPYLGWFIVFLMLIAPPSPLTNQHGPNPALRTRSLTSGPAEQLGRRWARAIKGFRLSVGGARPAPTLPEPPESLAVELGVASEPTIRARTVSEKRLQLQTLRSRGVLSEAEFIRLTKGLQ